MSMSPPRLALASLSLLLCAEACTAAIDPGGGAPAPPPTGGASAGPPGGGAPAAGDRPSGGAGPTAALAAAPGRVRRLTAAELESSARDVFLGGKALAAPFADARPDHGFDNQIDTLTIALPVIESVQAFAEQVAAEATARLGELAPCDVPKTGEAACAAQFVDQVGRRAFRRPVTAEEKAGLQALYASARKVVDHRGAIGALVEGMIQSPAFLYRTELGRAAGKIERIARYETASALSYFLWSTTPDDTLLQAAASGELDERAGVERQARRLLADPRARGAIRRMLEQWIELAPAGDLAQDPALGADIGKHMLAETAAFIDQVVWAPGGSLATLLTSPSTFVNGPLARLYGVPAPTGTGLQPVALDATKRAGVLTQPAFLGAHLGQSFSPVHLGRFVRRKVLCGELPDPPNDVPPLPPAGPNVSTRQRFAQHVASPSCAGCHRLMDPLGFAFESFDSMGRHRAMESGRYPLTGEGELIGTDVDGVVRGVPELAKKLSTSRQVATCFAKQAFSYALGRPPREATWQTDAAALADVVSAGGPTVDLQRVLLAITLSDAFVLRDTRDLPALANPSNGAAR